MQTVGEALGGLNLGQSGRRSGQRVHRDTKTQRGQEGRFWQPFSSRNASRYMRAAERYDRIQRYAHRRERNGRKNGPLGHIGLDVLREMLRLVDFRTGRLDPAIATIATRIGRSIAATAEALKRLRDHGFLNWIRRYEPTGGQGLRGPQVRQISNAYVLALPAAAQLEREAPAPEDDAHRRELAAADHEQMIQSLPLPERMQAGTDDPELAAILTRLGQKLGVS